jgi:hypothetical protein
MAKSKMMADAASKAANTKRPRKSTAPKAAPGAVSPAPSRRRASQRARGIELELGYPGKLRPLMIEHSRTEADGYLTVYAGVRGEFLSAGVPPEFLPAAGSVQFEIRRKIDSSNLLRATMSVIGTDRLELEIDWADEMPGDYGHPAICELARMISIDLGLYYRDYRSSSSAPDLEYPIRELLADERAVDFRPRKGAPALQISADFYVRLQNIASHARWQVHRYGEVFPVQTVAEKTDPKGSPMRLVVDNGVRL